MQIERSLLILLFLEGNFVLGQRNVEVLAAFKNGTLSLFFQTLHFKLEFRWKSGIMSADPLFRQKLDLTFFFILLAIHLLFLVFECELESVENYVRLDGFEGRLRVKDCQLLQEHLLVVRMDVAETCIVFACEAAEVLI